MGLPLMWWRLSLHYRNSVRQSAVMRTVVFQLERLSRRERAPAPDAMMPSIARVLTRVAVPVDSHVDAMRPFKRAIVQTPTTVTVGP